MKINRTYFAVALFFGLCFTTSLPAATPLPTLEDVVRRVDAHFGNAKTLQFHVDRNLERGLQKQTERWEVQMQRPDLFRVEYDGPPKRIVISAGDLYSEYIPEGKRALELNVPSMTDKAREQMLEALMPRVSIPGFRLGLDEATSTRLGMKVIATEQRDGRPTYVLAGEEKEIGKGRKAKGRMKIWVDADRYVLQRVEVYEGNQFVSSIDAEGFQEARKGVWFPSRIVVQNNTPDAFEKAVYRVSNVAIDRPFQDSNFVPQYASGVDVMRPQNGNTPASAQPGRRKDVVNEKK